jgi:putative tryptophan/tyrosine transport system substrate-binding protein
LLAAGAALPALGWTGTLRAQAKPPVLIGWLEASARDRDTYRVKAFKEGMAALGWQEGVNYVLEERWAQGQMDRLPALAAEIAAKKPAIIVTTPSDSTQYAAKAAPSTPIVQANGGPLLVGLIKSIARPGGMVTGLTNINTEIGSKHVELLRDAVPGVRRIGYLRDMASSKFSTGPTYLEEIRRAADHFRLELKVANVSGPQDIEQALSRLAKDGARALILGNSSWFSGERQRMVKFCLAQRWPFIANSSEWADAGALASYGANRAALVRRSAYFVDRILKGTKPGDLPIERPTKFETVVNLKIAKTLGLTIPQTVMVRVDRVIE